MLTKFPVVIILQYEHKSSYCTSKLIQCFIYKLYFNNWKYYFAVCYAKLHITTPDALSY